MITHILERQADEQVRPLDFHRDAIHEWDHVASNLVFEGEDRTPPRATIAITTYQRPRFLPEAIRCVLAQTTEIPFEIIVVDNDPASTGVDALLREFPELRRAAFRYFVHAENMGIFGNFNRALTLARGEWMSILNDDDLLAPDYLTKMFAVIDGRGDVDGIISGQDLLDERPALPEVSPAPRMTRDYVRTLVKQGPEGWWEIARRGWGRVLHVAHRAAFAIRFRGEASRRIRPATFFWGPALGNGAGFIFRVDVAKALGGFYAEEFPASDLFFFARFADRYHLRQHRDVAATYRIAENESAKLSTAYGALLWIHKMQLVLLGGGRVPKWWRRLAPMMIAEMRTGYRQVWRLDIPREQIEALLKIKVPDDRPQLLFAIRFLLGGL